MPADNAGGFIPYSPAPSSLASSSSPATLPHPRSSPLKPGGTKESSFIRHVDQQILHIQRRFAKRDAAQQQAGITEIDEEGRRIEEIDDPFTTAKLARSDEWHDVPGYATFADAARNVEELVGVIWVSGTPSLQIPYLISLALLTTTMIPAFPASPRQLFRLLAKLDHAFASLLHGRDVETDEPLPGFRAGRGVSGTEKVRIKSLVERTRVCVVEVMSMGGYDEDDEYDADMTLDATSDEDLDGDLVLDVEDDAAHVRDLQDWDMRIAKVFDKTLVELGDSMEGPAIGIPTSWG